MRSLKRAGYSRGRITSIHPTAEKGSLLGNRVSAKPSSRKPKTMKRQRRAGVFIP
jgi:hypothetical protein